MNYLLDDLIEFEKTAGIFDKLRKKKFPNQIRKLSNPTVYEKIQALPPDLRIKYGKDSMKFNQDRWDYVHKNVKDSDFDQEGNLNDDKYFPLVDSFNKKYGKLTPMGYVYKKQANEGIAGQEKTASLTPTFYQAVKEDNVQRVRIMMKDSLLVDPTFKEYNQMKDAAKNMKGLYDKHDGRSYSLDKNTWNDNYMDTEMVRAVGNFSPERTQHLQDVVSHLRPEAHNAAPKVEPNPAPWPHKKMALGVGAGLATLGGGAYLYNRYKKKKRAQAEQEKTAAPMFGKGRYKPRNTNSQWSRLSFENDLNRYKKFSNAPDFDESAYEKSQQAIDEYRPINLEEDGKTLKNVFSSLIAADMARRGGMHLLSGNKPAAKRFGVAAGLASIYPAYRGVEGLKRRYHFSKEKNIEADKAEVAKDDAARSAYRDYLDKYNGGEGGWHATWNTLSDASKQALLNEAKKKNARIQYNEDYSTNFVSPKGKKSKRRWENAGYLDEDDFDDSDISLRRLSKKTADQEKTAGVSKTIYNSKSKLKDAAFGTYKKGPHKGDNKFNVAYGKRAVKKHYEKLFDMHTDLGEQQRKPENATWNINGYNKSFDKKTKVGQENRSSIKHDYDDAFVEAAARPVALTALGLGVGIYGGKKLLDRYKKRQEEKKEQSYYV